MPLLVAGEVAQPALGSEKGGPPDRRAAREVERQSRVNEVMKT